MKRTEPQQVGNILKAMMESDGNPGEYDRRKAAYLWSEIVGPTINQVTARRFVEDDKLHVFITSSVIKSELAFMLPALIDALNNAIGSHIINKIIIH